jgi:hypothetical protein
MRDLHHQGMGSVWGAYHTFRVGLFLLVAPSNARCGNRPGTLRDLPEKPSSNPKLRLCNFVYACVCV